MSVILDLRIPPFRSSDPKITTSNIAGIAYKSGLINYNQSYKIASEECNTYFNFVKKSKRTKKGVNTICIKDAP